MFKTDFWALVINHSSCVTEPRWIPNRPPLHYSQLCKSCPMPVDSLSLDSPHTKAHLLFQAHFSRLSLPSTDYLTDTKSVLDQAIRIIQVMTLWLHCGYLFLSTLLFYIGVTGCLCRGRMANHFSSHCGAASNDYSRSMAMGSICLYPSTLGNFNDSTSQVWEFSEPWVEDLNSNLHVPAKQSKNWIIYHNLWRSIREAQTNLLLCLEVCLILGNSKM